VSAGRHRKSQPVQVRLQRWVALSASALAAATVVPVAVALESAAKPGQTVTAEGAASPGRMTERAYSHLVSRSGEREPAVPRMSEVEGLAEQATAESTEAAAFAAAKRLPTRWASVALNVRADAREGSRLITTLDPGTKVQVTGTVQAAWAQVVRGERLAWVHREYLLRKKPAATRTLSGSSGVSGVSGRPCPDGSAVESGLVANTIKVYRAVCAAFPSVSSWGGRSGSGDHGAGRALDIMVTGSTGDAIAAYVRENASRLGVSEVIWAQRIWTVQRGSEGWRPMSDRGSTTANHYDHVHVSVY
jgi:hypothetical protein